MKRLLLTICMMISLYANAAEQINGIYYNLNSSNYTAEVTSAPIGSTKCSGDIVIPSTVNYYGTTYQVTSIGSNAFFNCSGLISVNIPYSVTSIGSGAFEKCSGLTSVNFPNSITSIGERTFSGCYALTSVNIPISVKSIGESAFSSCYALTSVNIPNSVTSIGGGAFNGCSRLTSVNIPNSVTSIESRAFYNCSGLTSVNISNSVKFIANYAFSGCSGLTSVNIPNSVTSIGHYAFDGCSGLTSVNIPNSVTFIGDYAFSGCSGLTSVNIPNSVTSIGNNAFYRCSGLTSVNIPNSVKSIGIGAFRDASCKTLVIEGTPSIGYSCFGNFIGKVYAPSSLKSQLIDAGLSSSSFYASYDDIFSDHITPLLKGFIYDNQYFETTLNWKNPEFYDEEGKQLSCTKTGEGRYLVKGLEIGRYQTITAKYTDASGTNQSKTFNVRTSAPSFSISSTSTQSTITVKNVTATPSSDESCSITGTGLYYNNTLCNLPYIIKKLYPGESVSVRPYAIFDGEIYYGSHHFLETSSINLYISSQNTPTTLKLSGTYSKNDATITEEKITINGKTYEGNIIFVSGLKPNTSYSIIYSLKANGYTSTKAFYVSTAAIEMKTAAPKIITEGNAIIAAQTNISDVEKNVGFEWRRTDWTSDFASNTANAYLYKGQMEGYIRNLNASKLWKYRPYYLSDSGNYYYGDWMGFDPSNTSYFDPTVHTYDEIQIEGNTALVKGYALRGTDNIKVQGFVYWKKANATRAKGINGDTQIEAVPTDAMRVEATGQIMIATLTGLDYSTEYCYMAFATTIEGETFYGEEMSFRTPEGKVCASPNITFDNGAITCTTETEGAECHYTYSITGEGMNNGIVNSKKIEISAIAKADGYADSEKVVKTFDYTPGASGDVNGDGKITMDDANIVVNMYLGK